MTFTCRALLATAAPGNGDTCSWRALFLTTVLKYPTIGYFLPFHGRHYRRAAYLNLSCGQIPLLCCEINHMQANIHIKRLIHKQHNQLCFTVEIPESVAEHHTFCNKNCDFFSIILKNLTVIYLSLIHI